MTSLDADTLAAVLECEGYGLVPLTTRQRMLAALEARTSRRSASVGDGGSTGLRRRLDSVARMLQHDVRRLLEDTPLLWIESGLPHAATLSTDAGQVVVVCRGLFDMLHFQIASTTVVQLMARFDPVSDNLLEGRLPPSELFHTAGHVILADAYARLRVLPTIADLLGRRAAADVELGASTSLLLLVLHELGHVVSGHTDRVRVGTAAAVEVVHRPATIEMRRTIELSADAYSIDAVAPEWRAELLGSLIHLHNAFHFFETFGLRPLREYPSTDERLTAMIARSGLRDQDRCFAESWLADYRKRQAVVSQAASPEELMIRLTESMDVETACAVIHRIRKDLAEASIILDRE